MKQNSAQPTLAVLYQAQPAPAVDGIIKPMKEGGYSDSGADIAVALSTRDWPLICPVDRPQQSIDDHWVFPDTDTGIQQAIDRGAKGFWLNTVLYEGHPISNYFERPYVFIGQRPDMVQRFDDKLFTNNRLKSSGLPILAHRSISAAETPLDLEFPVVLKPIRGRGSQGVSCIRNQQQLEQKVSELLKQNIYGNTLYVEPFLPGEEITVTVMPPGIYWLEKQEQEHLNHWCLPVVKRVNHEQGIAPYSGKVLVTENSSLWPQGEELEAVKRVLRHCAQAAGILQARAPLRIDCRANHQGTYYIFDVNLKPNMTGSIRAHRTEQDGLCALAARGVGWSYADMIVNIAKQSWMP